MQPEDPKASVVFGAPDELEIPRAELIESEKAKAVARLAEGVIHDFRNLLLAVGANVELVSRELSDDHISQKNLELIRQAVSQGNELTESLLLLARRSPSVPEPFSVHRLVSRVGELAKKLLPPTVDLRVQPGADDWYIHASQTEVQQALISLIFNARDAMPAGGKLWITVTRDLSHPSSQLIKIEIKDSGGGMTPEVLSRATEPYFTTKARGQGTGLGLALVKSLVDSLSGSLSLQSETGSGTTVSIRLPLCQRPLQSLLQVPAPGIALVVEADALLRAMITSMLRQLGFEASGAAAFEDVPAILSSVHGPVSIVFSQPSDAADLGRTLETLAASHRFRRVVMIADQTSPSCGGRNLVIVKKPFGLHDLRTALSAAPMAPQPA